jgi:hypothetical protein
MFPTSTAVGLVDVHAMGSRTFRAQIRPKKHAQCSFRNWTRSSRWQPAGQFGDEDQVDFDRRRALHSHEYFRPNKVAKPGKRNPSKRKSRRVAAQRDPVQRTEGDPTPPTYALRS